MRSFADSKNLGSGLFYPMAAVLAAVFSFSPSQALAADGASEALEVRLQAERAILQEKRAGNGELAGAMEQALPELLLEYLVTRDGSVALDTIDAVFVREELETAKAMAEPGIAIALDVHSGPGTGYEHGIRNAITRLSNYQLPQETLERASEAMLATYERQFNHTISKLESLLEGEHPQAIRVGAKLDAKADRRVEKIVRKANRLAGIKNKKVKKVKAPKGNNGGGQGQGNGGQGNGGQGNGGQGQGGGGQP